jgi:protein tyrosine phosphatase (PTP) superfamily phosphohydrolase (DUF442 family)
MIKNFLLLIAFLFFTGCLAEKNIERKKYYAEPIKGVSLENMHNIDNKIYRSAQPSKEEYKKLYAAGLRYNLNLREFHDDKEKLEGLNIKYHRVPIRTSRMSYEQLVEAVAYLSQTEGKTLVHCLHGSDRTGTVIAGYRIAVEGWEKQKAIDEFENGGYGFHSLLFQNLPELLHSLDVTKFRSDVKHYTFKEDTF